MFFYSYIDGIKIVSHLRVFFSYTLSLFIISSATFSHSCTLEFLSHSYVAAHCFLWVSAIIIYTLCTSVMTVTFGGRGTG